MQVLTTIGGVVNPRSRSQNRWNDHVRGPDHKMAETQKGNVELEWRGGPARRWFLSTFFSKINHLTSLKLTWHLKWMVGILVSFSETRFSGAMLVSGRVTTK